MRHVGAAISPEVCALHRIALSRICLAVNAAMEFGKILLRAPRNPAVGPISDRRTSWRCVVFRFFTVKARVVRD